MRKICGLIQFIDAKALEPVQTAAAHDQGAERTGLAGAGANDDQLQFAAGREGIVASLHPGILLHRAVGFFSKQRPSLGLVFDGTEFLDNAHGGGHYIY